MSNELLIFMYSVIFDRTGIGMDTAALCISLAVIDGCDARYGRKAQYMQVSGYSPSAYNRQFAEDYASGHFAQAHRRFA